MSESRICLQRFVPNSFKKLSGGFLLSISLGSDCLRQIVHIQLIAYNNININFRNFRWTTEDTSLCSTASTEYQMGGY